MQDQTNPLLCEWDTPFQVPPFALIAPHHFLPAFDVGFAAHQAEIDSIAANTAPADFENTLLALESAGGLLARCSAVFFNLVASHSSDTLRAIEREIAPRLAAHQAAFFLHAGLFARIEAVARQRDALDAQSGRLLSRYLLDFERAGARLAPAQRREFAANAERLAHCFTQFSHNVLADESTFQMVLSTPQELAGLPVFVVSAARQAAIERGVQGANAHVITLSRSSITPFMMFSERRDLRQHIWQAWCARGENAGAHDNRPLMREILQLRLAQARLLGYANFTDFALADTMAGNAGAVQDLLMRAWPPAQRKALDERAALAAQASEETGRAWASEDIQPWDWHYWTEKVRQRKFALNEAQIKPFLQLERLSEAMFYVANRLFGLEFMPRSDISTYHASVKAWEVRDTQGRHVGIFLTDNFARSGKRSGAWMSHYRQQCELPTAVRPIVVNNNNFSQAPAGEPTLLSLDDARTLFHEFGHGLHGLLSQCRYKRLSGTSVLRDFVEFPSQIFENWLLQPVILQAFATHSQTGLPMEAALLEKIVAAQTFNQGFATVEYLASALVDLKLHQCTDLDTLDLHAFEQRSLEVLGMPAGIGMRHRLPHFLHLFSSNAYASAYYVYLWAEVLDADGFDAFIEKGDVLDSTLGQALMRHIYAAGNQQDPMQAYMAFRGRPPAVEPMLRKRGLLAAC
jgi:peptidyl-dipeptidase Dcp